MMCGISSFVSMQVYTYFFGVDVKSSFMAIADGSHTEAHHMKFGRETDHRHSCMLQKYCVLAITSMTKV